LCRLKELTAFPNDPWDFGLNGDSIPVRFVARFYVDLWPRLEDRREALKEYWSEKHRSRW
jgi:hypothetical protein